MIYKLEKLKQLFDRLVGRVNKHGGSVIILSSTQVDSLCATKLLTSLLVSENISYRIFPITDYVRFTKQVNSFGDEFMYLICVNCGGRIDLKKEINDYYKKKVEILLLDSHRPIHHANFETDSRLTIIDDQTIDFKSFPTKEEF